MLKARWSRRRRHLTTAAALLIMIVVSSCTTDPPPGPGPSTPPVRPPTSAFPALAGRVETGARTQTRALATLDNHVVSAGLYWDGTQTATFGWSGDGGQTWQAGTAAAPDQPVSERVDHLAVRPQSDGPTWLAVGQAGESFVRWSSPDGTRWDRTLIDRTLIDPIDEDINDLAVTDQGFVASGEVTDHAGQARPRVWSSADGVSWVEHRLPGAGSVNQVAGRGRTWVAVGMTDQDWRVWRSSDAGDHWTVVTKIPRVASDSGFVRRLGDVVVHQDQFTAIGSFYDDDLDGQGTAGYQAVIMRSRDGLTWTHDTRSSALRADGNSLGTTLVSHGDELVAVVQRNQTLNQDRVWRLTGGRWSRMYDERPQGDAAVWSVDGLARTEQGWVAAANRTLNNAMTAQLWRAAPHSQFFEPVDPPPTPRSTPVSHPTELVRWAGSWRVLGETRDRRGLWTQGVDGRFDPPRETDLSAAASIQGLAADGKVLLTYGRTDGGNSNFATVWRSRDGTTFTPTDRDTFEQVDRYSYSSINDLHKFGSTWFAVGERSVNGDLNVSALVATSKDGKTWRAGKPARVLTKARDDEVWYDVTDLAGDHDRRRSMSDVTRTRRDYLAVGWSEENGPKQATVWHSRDGRTWRSSVIGARGFDRSEIANAASIGNRTVLSGWVGRRGQTKTLPYAWSSADGGRSWSGRVVGRLGDTAGELVATDTQFVLEGSADGEVSHPLVQQSADGLTWAPLPLTGFDAAPEDDVWVSDLRADGPDIVALVRVANRVGAGSVVVRQTVG